MGVGASTPSNKVGKKVVREVREGLIIGSGPSPSGQAAKLSTVSSILHVLRIPLPRLQPSDIVYLLLGRSLSGLISI